MKQITNTGNITNFFPPEADGTHLITTIETTYKHLTNLFGKEDSNGDGYKVQAEWFIITPDGIGTIYDYKQGKSYNGKDGISKQKVTDWHIGGHNQATADHIIKTIQSIK